MKQLYFATKNKGKLASVNRIFSKYGIEAIQFPIKFPEPRTDDVKEIVKEKVLFAWQKIKKPCIALDAGFFIPSLNGFPKAFVNFALETIGIEGLLKLVEGKSRDCEFRESLAFFDHSLREPLTYWGVVKGRLAEAERGEKRDYFWSDLFYVFIPEGKEKTLAEMEPEEYFQWSQMLDKNSYLGEFAEWFLKKFKETRST
jgi:XTP/dITP diphosphohydrolase